MSEITPQEDELLKAVSRTFYLSMRLLPAEMRRAVSVAYLLARASDSVADTSTAAPEVRLAVLRDMALCLAGEADAEETERLFMRLGGAMAQAQKNPAEFRLLRFFGDCLSQLEALPETEKAPVRRVLGHILEGQMWDLTAFAETDTVADDEATRRYTWQVAGCVGEFWTELGYAVLGERFAPETRRAVLTRAAARYGQGLQLVNILRDREEDAARGRRYLCSDPAVWMDRAERYLQDGVDYSSRLRGFRLRLASVLPAMLGLKTLKLLRRSGAGHVKISRACVYRTLLAAAFFALCPPRA